MGEIADAIRRARGAPGPAPVRGGVALRSFQELPPAPRPSVEPIPPEAQPHPVDHVEPKSQAVVLDDGPNAEACRHLAMRVRTALDARQARSVAIVSAERGDGKTTVACNLAISLATLSRSREIALVDLDLRKPSIAECLALPPGGGVDQVLLGKAELETVPINVQHPAFDVYPVSVPQRKAHELLVLPQLGEIIRELERRYATVIIDTPPAPLVPDANLVLRHVPACVPVVRAGKTRARSFRRLLDCLPGERVMGWILNCERLPSFAEGDYYYGEEPENLASGVRRKGKAS